MKITIKNFRAIKSAEFTVDKIALIGSKNGRGKTSIVQAITAASTDNVVPLRLVDKKSATLLVHSGTASGSVNVVQENNAQVTVEYPTCTKTSQGVYRPISGISAGYESLIDMSTQQRTDLLKRILRADVTREDLAAEFEKAKIAPEFVESAWKNICAQGWDAAHAAATEKGAKLKGAWEQITGERYGARKAASWLPAAYDATIPLPELEASLKNERAWLEAAIVHTAVEELDTAKYKEQVAQLPALKKAHADNKAETERVVLEYRQITIDLNKYPDLTDKSQPCPHCKKKLYIINGKISAEGMTAEQIAALKKQQTELTARQAELKQKIDQMNTDGLRVHDCIMKANEAERKLAEIESQKSDGNATADQVHECRNKVTLLEAKLGACNAKKLANEKAASIIINQKVCDILSPKGIRLAKITEALGTLNQKLDEVCRLSGWEPVYITPAMELELGGTPYFLLSESYQFRTRIALQVTIAVLLGDGIILIDRADMLDADGRNGLLYMLKTTNDTYKLKALVAMTFSKPEQVPLLTGIGESYWIESGNLVALQK